jgi:hypothetical protein
MSSQGTRKNRQAELQRPLGAYRRMTAVERGREVMTRYADWLNGDAAATVVAFPTSRKA